MSDMSKAARAAMKAKATRMGGKGEPKTKVDASTWSPPEMMNTGMKVGMRPLTRRAFKKGGKVIEKCEGGPTAVRADRKQRKQRKAGGRSLVTDLINRNDKKANKAREGGDAHTGGYAKGGKTSRYYETVKDHDRWDESKEKWMPRTKRRLTDEGEMKFGPGGKPSDADNPDKFRPGEFKRGGDVDQDKKLVKKAFAQHDKNMHGGKHEELKLKKGGPAKKQYGGSAKKPIPGDAPTRGPDGGSQATGEPYQNIDELMKAKGIGKKRGGGTYFGGTRPTGGRMPKADGGKSDEDYWTYKAASKTPELEEAIKAKAIHPKTTEDDWAKLSPGMRREILRSAQRKGRKAGGRTKGKTNIIISVNAGKPQDQQAMMPKMPTPSPLPVPPVAPPPMGAGAPPPMPPMPPPGLAGGPPPPPGMPPMPRKRGGRAYKSYKDMDAGALSGMGRMEKTEIEHGKRVGRLSGGRARSYKDMDAGALGGMGRIEKTAIQKHKR